MNAAPDLRKGCPARVVAVTRLLLDLLDALCDQELDTMSGSEADLVMLLIPHLDDLRTIEAMARAEMSQLAPAVLAT